MGKKPSVLSLPKIEIYASDDLPAKTYRVVEGHRIVVSLDIYEQFTDKSIFKEFTEFKADYKIQSPIQKNADRR